MIALLGSRILAAVVLLVALIAAYALLPDQFPLLVSATFAGALIVQFIAARFFIPKAVANDSIVSLRLRAQDVFAGLLGLTTLVILGGILVGRALALIPDPVDRGVFLVGLSFALLMLASPALNALLTWQPWTD